MKAVVVDGPRDVVVRELPEPRPGPSEQLVAVDAAGICGTDLKIVEGSIPVAYPRVLGHEVVGRVVTSCPDGVPSGTRVLVDPFRSCGRCGVCQGGRRHLCPRGELMGRDADGGLAGLLVAGADRLLPVPDSLGDGEVALLQVLGTCVHAQTRIGTTLGQTAVVIGLGVSGLLHVQMLALRGCRVVGVTRSPEKRAMAEQLGAVASAHPDDARAVVEEVTSGMGADIVVESAGAPTSLQQAIDLAGMGASVLLFGIVSAPPPGLELYDLYFKELDVVNARAALPRDYATAIRLAASGRVRLAPLWSGSVPIDDAPAAFDRLRAAGDLKVTLSVG